MSGRASGIVLGLLGLCGLFLGTCFVHIGPDEIGIRTDNVSLGRTGIVQRDFGPGYHLRLPLLHTWNVLPARTRRVELTKDVRHRSAIGSEALLVTSDDGDRVMLDIDIFFRVKPGKGHRIVQDSGPGDAHVRVLLAQARDRLRAVFGQLRTEQFYDSAARDAKTGEALEALAEAMQPRFLEPVALRIQDVEFEPKYEQKIKDKKLADQLVELNKAQTRAAAERAKVGAIRLDTERQVKLTETGAVAEAARLHAEAEKYGAGKRAEADLYRAELAAKGTLAVALAEAKVKKAKTSALSGSGGANLAALESVQNFKIESIAFPTSGGDFFDVRSMATRLGARP